MSEIKVSIIIPVYNVENYIEECLTSVIRQEGTDEIPLECIIVDDRGPDRSMEIARRVVSEYSGPIRFKIITLEKNGGLSAARNSGIHEAAGDYLFFLDSDDVIAPHCIRSLWSIVGKHPGVDIVYGQTVSFPDADFNSGYLNLHNGSEVDYSDKIEIVRDAHLRLPETAWNRLVRRRFILDNKLYFKEGIIHENTYWQLASYTYVKSFACDFSSQPTYLYRQREGSIMDTADNLTRCRRLSAIIKENIAKYTAWDAPLCKYLSNYLFSFRFHTQQLPEEQCRKIYREDIAFFRRQPQAQSPRLRLLFAYMALPRPLMRVRLLYSLIDRIKH